MPNCESRTKSSGVWMPTSGSDTPGVSNLDTWLSLKPQNPRTGTYCSWSSHLRNAISTFSVQHSTRRLEDPNEKSNQRALGWVVLSPASFKSRPASIPVMHTAGTQEADVSDSAPEGQSASCPLPRLLRTQLESVAVSSCDVLY